MDQTASRFDLNQDDQANGKIFSSLKMISDLPIMTDSFEGFWKWTVEHFSTRIF
jgi:hypothetical protein